MQWGGKLVEIPHAAELGADVIHTALATDRGFAQVFDLGHLSSAQTQVVREGWVAHCDLPADRPSVLRLLSTIDRFEVELEHDLQRHLQVDLEQLWRDRQWRRLLSFIDRLPRDSSYMTALLAMPEFVQRAAAEKGAAQLPPTMTWWSEEVEALACVRDLLATLIRVNLAAGGVKNLPPAEPVTRPTAVLERASRKTAWEKHKALAKRVLAVG